MAQNTINTIATVNNTNSKEETNMNNTMNTNGAFVIAMTKEEVVAMSKTGLYRLAQVLEIKGRSSMSKTQLIEAIVPHCDPTKKVEIVTVEPVVEEKEEEKMDKKADALLAKWDKLVTATAKEYVAQSLGKKWALFYKNTKGKMSTDAYMVKTNKLFGATAKVIRTMYGEKHTNEDTIKQLLNVMVIRGYLNFKKVNGEKGENIIFSATADQMNAMWKLSK